VTAIPKACPDGDRHVVLLGRPGSGPTPIGRRLAALLQRPFADAAEQLELAAGSTVSRLAHERGEDHVRRREAQVLTDLLARDAPLVISAPGAVAIGPGDRALLARSAVVLWTRGRDDVRSPPGLRLPGDYGNVADHVVDVEPFHAGGDEPHRAIAHHILQLFVTGDLRGAVRVPDRTRSPWGDCERDLAAHLEDVADLVVDVEPFHAGDDEPERAIARHIARLLARDDAPPTDPA
jgi:Shikimate kinase